MKYTALTFSLPIISLLAACAPVTPPMNTATPPDQHTSQSALDWQGSYAGDLPCADCPGIRSTLALKANGQYLLTTQYADRSQGITETTGRFHWQTGKVIELLGANQQKIGAYQVRENALAPLTGAGKALSTGDGKLWLLHKVSDHSAAQDLYASYAWRLSSLAGQSIAKGSEAKAPYLTFLPTEQRVAGWDGCNRVAGGLVLGANQQLKFPALISTRMACVGVSIDGPFSKALEQTRSYALQGSKLQFKDAEGQVLATFQPVATPPKK